MMAPYGFLMTDLYLERPSNSEPASQLKINHKAAFHLRTEDHHRRLLRSQSQVRHRLLRSQCKSVSNTYIRGMLDLKRASSYSMLKMTPKVLVTAHFFQAMTIKLHEELENSFDGKGFTTVLLILFTLPCFC